MIAPLCGIKYEGPSYPQKHGTQCMLSRGHEGRHYAYAGHALSWWTPAEKAARQAATDELARRNGRMP